MHVLTHVPEPGGPGAGEGGGGRRGGGGLRGGRGGGGGRRGGGGGGGLRGGDGGGRCVCGVCVWRNRIRRESRGMCL